MQLYLCSILILTFALRLNHGELSSADDEEPPSLQDDATQVAALREASAPAAALAAEKAAKPVLKKGFFDAPRRPPSTSGRAPPLEEIKPKAGSAAGGGRKGLGSAGPAIPDFLRVEPEKRAGAIKDHIIVRAAPPHPPPRPLPLPAARGTPATLCEPALIGAAVNQDVMKPTPDMLGDIQGNPGLMAGFDDPEVRCAPLRVGLRIACSVAAPAVFQARPLRLPCARSWQRLQTCPKPPPPSPSTRQRLAPPPEWSS